MKRLLIGGKFDGRVIDVRNDELCEIRVPCFDFTSLGRQPSEGLYEPVENQRYLKHILEIGNSWMEVPTSATFIFYAHESLSKEQAIKQITGGDDITRSKTPISLFAGYMDDYPAREE